MHCPVPVYGQPLDPCDQAIPVCSLDNDNKKNRVTLQSVHSSVLTGKLLDITKVVVPLQSVQCSVPVVNQTMTMNSFAYMCAKDLLALTAKW